MNDTSLNVSNRIPFSAGVSDAWVIGCGTSVMWCGRRS